MLWRPSRPARSRSKPPGFILPCQPALSDRPPSGPEWLHAIKFDGYRVTARKDGARVRVWARRTSDYTAAFTRIRDAVAALPADKALIDGDAILPRADGSFDFEGLRSREGQAAAILVAYDVLAATARTRALSHWRPAGSAWRGLVRAKAIREGVQPSEALAGDGAAIFRHACGLGLEGIVSKRIGSRYVSGRTRAWLKTKNPKFERC